MKIQSIFLLLILAGLALLAADNPPPADAPEAVQAALTESLALRLAGLRAENASLAAELFDVRLNRAVLAPAGDVAVLWLALHDPETGRALGAEPGLALAEQVDGAWQVSLPGEPDFERLRAGLPDGMLPLEQSAAGLELDRVSPAETELTGYRLPWAAGYQHFMEGSISHFQSIPALGYPSCSDGNGDGLNDCRYAYDFTDTGHFPLLAAKAGTVYAARDSCPNDQEWCTNYIVLRESSGYYQIYIHLANGTIPDKLTAGASVVRGQYIGDTDDTGYSTSNHVHFMVTHNIWSGGDGYFWGQSVDIRFEDVALNNGIPRNCYEIANFRIYDNATLCPGPYNPSNPFQRDYYTSGNVGAFPPAGTLDRPANAATINAGSNELIDVTISATDDVRPVRARLLVKLNGEWVEAGPAWTTYSGGKFDWDVNLCDVGPLNGPTQFAARIWDHEGNVTDTTASPRTANVDHACLPPVSQLLTASADGSTGVRLTWSATDRRAGLGRYEIQWRPAGGAWDPAHTVSAPGSVREAWVGLPASTAGYEFRLRAFDANDQPEAWPAGDAAELSLAALTPTACAPGADFEDSDDIATGARAPGEGALCGAIDPDWFTFSAVAGKLHSVTARSLAGGAAVRIQVYADAAGTQLLGEAISPAAGSGTHVTLTPVVNGPLWVKVTPAQGVWGATARYSLAAAQTELTYLPGLWR